MTQEQLAKKIGISTGFMGDIERGNRGFTVRTFIKIVNALDVTPSTLAPTERDLFVAQVMEKIKDFTPEQEVAFFTFLASFNDNNTPDM